MIESYNTSKAAERKLKAQIEQIKKVFTFNYDDENLNQVLKKSLGESNFINFRA